MDLLRFVPIYQDRVWGGNNLATELGRALPHDGPIGEAWEIVDRPEAQSVHAESALTLDQLMADHTIALMGPDWDKTTKRPFPILVKWLDCQDRLSLQVHPPQSVANALGGEPKTECWFIAKAKPGASLFVGLKEGTSKALFEQTLTQSGASSLEPLLHRIEVAAGESILLESGRIHAIDAGNLILEIQQNSDTTYRVYDWDRLGLDNRPRQLHIEQSLASIDFEDFEPSTLPASIGPGERVIAECREFRIQQINLSIGESMEIAANQETSIVSVVSGSLVARPHRQKNANYITTGPLAPKTHTLGPSDNVICPYVWGGVLEAQQAVSVLITDRFTQ